MTKTTTEIVDDRARRLYSQATELQPGTPKVDWDKLPGADREFWRRIALRRIRSDRSIVDEQEASTP